MSSDNPEDLERQIAALQARLAQARSSQVETQGGAAVEGGVQLANGHFIGRDLVVVFQQAWPAPPEADEAQLLVAAYVDTLARDLARVDLAKVDKLLDKVQRKPIELADLYVDLDTTTPRERSEGREPRDGRLSALDALAHHDTLTLIGPPGSGKSTFGARVLLALAQAWKGHTGCLADLGRHWTFGPLLPLRVTLRRFAEVHAAGDRAPRAGDLWTFIGQDLQDRGVADAAIATGVLRQLARRQGALVLLDGLDECGSDDRRRRVQAAIDEFRSGAGPKCRFLLTARPYAFPDGADAEQGIHALAELDRPQIERFIGRWYDALVARGWMAEPDALPKRQDLLAAYRDEALLPLARTPLLLTLMATLHSNRGHLPRDRAELYDETVNLLLQRWNEDRGDDRSLLATLAQPGLTMETVRSRLEEQAFRLHAAHVGREGTADLDEATLVEAFRPVCGGSRDQAGLVVEFVERRAGLLLGQGGPEGWRRFTFPHRSFQEFLAACHLSDQPDFGTRCRQLAEQDANHWRVVLPLAARRAKAERGSLAADELIGGQTVDQARSAQPLLARDWHRALIAGLQLREIGLGSLAGSERRERVVERVRGWLVQALPLAPKAEGGMPAPQRALAGDALAALGDPRFDPRRGHLPADPMMGFVAVEADPDFVIGTRPEDRDKVSETIAKPGDDEINDKPVRCPAFWIGRYPVTVAQFKAYVEATGRQPGDADALRDPPTRPVRWVNWHEARYYCRWLQDRLADGDAFATGPVARQVRELGWTVALPSELEWERAARGGQADEVFPWGDVAHRDFANVGGSGVQGTSPVGCFPPNGFELSDMAGNVWEWTRSRYAAYPYDPADPTREPDSPGKDTPIVVRGGSWNDSLDDARCAQRSRFHPHGRNYDLGFRVVLRSPPVFP